MKSKYINLYIKMAEDVAKLSHAKRLQVGAVCVKDNRVISIGYNGTPAGWDNCCEHKVNDVKIGPMQEIIQDIKLVTKPEVLHAEANCLMKIAQSTESSTGATLFCTHSSCFECAKLIAQSGITAVYYKSKYRDENGIDFLKKCNIEVIQWNLDEENNGCMP